MNNDIDYESIGIKIRQERVKRHLTQFELSELSDMTPTNISHIERGATKLSLPAIVAIANALHISVDYLLYGSLNAPTSPGTAENRLQWELRDCTDAEKEALAEILIAAKNAIRRLC